MHHAYTIGAFHSIRTFETLETAANGTEISRKSFRNPGNGWISEMRTTEPSKVEWKKNILENFSKIWVYHARLSSFMEIFENATLFATGSCRKFNNRGLGWISLNLVPRSHSVFFSLSLGDLGTRLNFTLTRRWEINTENFLDANKETVSTFW